MKAPSRGEASLALQPVTSTPFDPSTTLAMVARQNRMLHAISRAQSLAMESSDPGSVFEGLLLELLALTQAQYGLIGEVLHGAQGQPYLKAHAITNIAWDEASRALYARQAATGMVFSNLSSLLGAALVTGVPVIANDPANDPRRGGLPPGHPPMNAFLGIPIEHGKELVAMVGLANQPGGFGPADVEFLDPLCKTIGQLVHAHRAERLRQRAQEELERTATLLAQRTEALKTTLDSMSQGIVMLDSQGRISVYNQRVMELLDLPDSLLASRPTFDEVFRFQADRGDFGDQFDMVLPTARAYLASRTVADRPESYLRQTRAGQVLEVVTRRLPDAGVVRTFSDVTERQQAHAQIERLAFYDALTGLPNRRLLYDRLHQTVAAGARSSGHGGLLFIDLDNFKAINDTHGHDVGDEVLKQVAVRLGQCVRQSDTVARLGGDEFVVMLDELSAHESEAAAQVEAIGRKILASLNQPFNVARRNHHSSPSIGVALFRDQRESADELLKRADLAMYQAKAAGRNTMRFFDPQMQSVVNERAALEVDLRLGLARDELLLHYQPVVDALGQTTGVEALARWLHPSRGLVSPAQFIPLAEQTGLILPLGQWVLEVACTQLVRWSAHAATRVWSMAVNVSARQFRHADFVQQVLNTLRTTGANPYRLKLELTESLLVSDVDDAIAKMSELRSIGVRFALDDFGTGYSSLSYLQRLPLDQLKIDQSFVRDVLKSANDAAIVRTILSLAHSMELTVVAEGVETRGQHQFLMQCGCKAFQGYLFGRPAPLVTIS